MSITTCFRIKLPAGFRQNDVLAFHRRDSQGISERIDGNVLRKGVMWQGHPACLSFRFNAASVAVELAIDDTKRIHHEQKLKKTARRMLGLTQRVDVFERAYGAHPQIGQLIERNSGLRVPLAPTPFEALSWAITGQQISVSAAVSVRRKLIQAVGLRHSGGLWCFPEPRQIANMTGNELRQAGFSKAKADTLMALSQSMEMGLLPLNDWVDAPPEPQIRAKLLAIRGIGPWTVNYALLRGFGCLDGSLHGDVAVRRNLALLLGKPGRISQDEAEEWLAAFSPWRALVAAHLWAIKRADAY